MAEEEGGVEAPPAAPGAAAPRRRAFDVQKLLEQRASAGQASGLEVLALIQMEREDRRDEREARRQQGNASPEVTELRKTVESLSKTVETMLKAKEFETLLGPLRKDISDLSERIDKLGERGGAPVESESMKDLKGAIGGLEKRLDSIDQRYQFTTEIQSLRTELTSLKEVVEKGGGGAGAPQTAADLIDQATGLIDKINELTKKSWAAGEGEGFDWKTAAITTTGEIATEAIKTAKAIYAGEEEERPRSEEEKAREKISEVIIDKKVLGYISTKLSTGAKEFNTKEAATALGLHPDQVFDSYKRLRDRGYLTMVPGGGKAGTKPGEKRREGISEEEAAGLVEGA